METRVGGGALAAEIQTTAGWSGGRLRPYQEKAIEQLRDGFARGHRRQVLVAPTGAGKAVVANGLVELANRKEKRVVFVVNRVQLVKQFSERLRAAGIEHGILRGEESRMTWHPILVASIQTVARRGLDVPADVIVIDECHAVPGSKDYMSFLHDHPDSAVIGLTATPWAKGMGRANPAIDGPLFSNAVVAASYSELLRDDYLVDCDVFAPGLPNLAGVKVVRNQFGEQDYADTHVGAAMNKPKLVGDIVSHWMRLARDLPTVVFACDIKHSMAITEAFNNAGVSAEHIDCYCDHKERQEILARVDSGKTMVISCAALLAEGWDQPSIRCAILARPTKSQIRYVQMVGRVLRPAPGKTRALLLDHSGSVHRLGFPTDDRDYTLDGHKPTKSAAAARKREATPCPKCGWLEPGQGAVCPSCGFERKVQSRAIEAEDGELQRLKRTKVTREEKQKFYSEVLAIAGERKRSPGWAAHTYRKKFGVWPRGLREVASEPTPQTRGYVQHLMIAYAKRMSHRSDAAATNGGGDERA